MPLLPMMPLPACSHTADEERRQNRRRFHDLKIVVRVNVVASAAGGPEDESCGVGFHDACFFI